MIMLYLQTNTYCYLKWNLIIPIQLVMRGINEALHNLLKISRWEEGPSLQVKVSYPGWCVWLYTEPREKASVLCPLLQRHDHLYICDVTALPDPLRILPQVHPMMWRVAPLGDPRVVSLLVRDTDSKVSNNGVLLDVKRHINILFFSFWNLVERLGRYCTLQTEVMPQTTETSSLWVVEAFSTEMCARTCVWD